jgi:hypothetical protein
VMSEDRGEQILAELAQIRSERHGPREAFEKRGLQEELDHRISELEIEERLRQIQDEIVIENQPPRSK